MADRNITRLQRFMLALLCGGWLVLAPTRVNALSDAELAEAIQRLADPDHKIRKAAVMALGNQGPRAKAAIPPLLKRLTDSEVQVSMATRDALDRIDKDWTNSPFAKAAIPEFVEQLGDKNVFVSGAAANALQRIDKDWTTSAPAQAAIPVFLKRLTDQDNFVRNAAKSALSTIDKEWPKSAPAKEHIPYFIRHLTHEDGAIRAEAAKTLGVIGPDARSALPELVNLLADRDGDVGRATMIALGQIDKQWVASDLVKAAIPAIIKQLAAGERELRITAANALKWIGPTAADALPELEKRLNDDDRYVRSAVADAIRKIRK